MKLLLLAQEIDAELDGPGDIEISGIAGIGEAAPGQITFVADDRHLGGLSRSRASAVIVAKTAPAVLLPALRVANPRLAFARVLGIFHPTPQVPGSVSDRAVISESARVGDGAIIHPFVTISDGASIGRRTILHPGVVIGKDSSVGDDCILYPNVTVYHGVNIGSRVIIHAGAVLGSDGFGFVTEGGVHHKIPQVGGVIIGEDVEIGANSTIDRATMGNTIVRKGTKIDNQVQVAHNVTLGEHCLIAAQSGVAGSTALGNYVVMGGHSAVGDHLTVGDRVMVGGGSGIAQDVAAGQVVGGYYAMPIRDWLKVQAVLPKLPEIKKRLAELERTAEDLKKRSAEEEGRQ